VHACDPVEKLLRFAGEEELSLDRAGRHDIDGDTAIRSGERRIAGKDTSHLFDCTLAHDVRKIAR
jgi:hypothetical protein